MARYRLCHTHAPDECGACVAAWRGFTSPLRGGMTVSSCASGRHRIWWDVEAGSAAAAMAMLPGFVALRTDAIRVDDQDIP